MSDRLSRAIRASGPDPALGMFLTCGFPSPDVTLGLMHAMENGGADFIELGMPFSDPLAEGGPIQRSSARALAAGMTMRRTLQTAAAFREASTLPLVLMGYANPVMRFGLGNFFSACRSSGVDGLILPDVPVEEAKPFLDEASKHDVNLIFLVSPLTPAARLRHIDTLSSGFVYAVSVAGVTGAELPDPDHVVRYVAAARQQVRANPLLVGFGIRTREDVLRYAAVSDGCIVGSELVREIERAESEMEPTDSATAAAASASAYMQKRVRQFVHMLKHGAKPPTQDQ